MGKSLIPCGLTAGWRRSEMSKYCRSFTLLEIILALTILSVLTALAGTVLFASQRGGNSIQESSAELETLQRLDGIADTAFRNAVPFTGQMKIIKVSSCFEVSRSFCVSLIVIVSISPLQGEFVSWNYFRRKIL